MSHHVRTFNLTESQIISKPFIYVNVVNIQVPLSDDNSRAGRMAVTLRPERFATEMTLVWLLAAVYSQMHVEVVLLGKCVATRVTDKRSLIPVKQNKNIENKMHRSMKADLQKKPLPATCEWL